MPSLKAEQTPKPYKKAAPPAALFDGSKTTRDAFAVETERVLREWAIANPRWPHADKKLLFPVEWGVGTPEHGYIHIRCTIPVLPAGRPAADGIGFILEDDFVDVEQLVLNGLKALAIEVFEGCKP